VSRYNDEGDGAEYNNAAALWQNSIKLALRGKRGLKVLREMREALLALPEPKLIDRALCTAAVEVPEHLPEYSRWEPGVDFAAHYQNNQIIELAELVGEVGEGVCAVGAYVWWKRVKAGEDPQAVFESMPVLPDTDSDMWQTVEVGTGAGLGVALAWEFAYRNDEVLGGLSPEERYTQYLAWLDEQIATHPLVAA
jgi:hypothetical protein